MRERERGIDAMKNMQTRTLKAFQKTYCNNCNIVIIVNYALRIVVITLVFVLYLV